MRKQIAFILGLVLLTVAVFAIPAPQPWAGSVTDINNCRLSCGTNVTGAYVCNYGEEARAQCFFSNSTGQNVVWSPFQVGITSPSTQIMDCSTAWDDEAKYPLTGEYLDDPFWTTTGSAGCGHYLFYITPDYAENTNYTITFRTNQTLQSFYFYVTGDAIEDKYYNSQVQSGEDIVWLMENHNREQDQCTATIQRKTDSEILRLQHFTWQGNEHELRISSWGLAWDNYWLNVTCGNTYGAKHLNIAFNNLERSDIDGPIALIAGNAQWIAFGIISLFIILIMLKAMGFTTSGLVGLIRGRR